MLSASRLSQPLSEAPNAMTVIERDMIVASGFRNLADVFNLVPGMYVSYYTGAQPIVSYHGSTDQYARSMQVMIDGRSVYMPPASTVDWASLPIVIDDIERIEVIRGPAAASYGANSVHGVINIITRDAGAINDTRVSVTRGNKGVNDVTSQFGHNGENFDYRMTLAYRTDNGYDDRTATHFPSIFAADMNNSNDSNQARLMNYRASFYPNSSNNFDVQMGVNRDVQGVGFWDSHWQLNPFHDLKSLSSFQQLTWLHQLADASELSVRLSHTRNSYQENYMLPATSPATGGVAVPVAKALSADRTALEVQHTLDTGATNRLIYGFQYSDERAANNVNVPVPVVNPANLISQVTAQSARVFFHDEWRVTPKFIVNTGGMFENDGQGGKKLSPRTSLNYHFTPKQTLRLGASVAYRTPSMVENYGTSALNYQVGDRFIVGNTSLHLNAEKMLSREIGYLGEFDDWASSIDVRVFRDQFEGVIYPTNVFFSNGMSGQYDGVETTLKHRFTADAEMTLNYAREYARSNIVSLQLFGYDALAASTPANTVSALFSQHLGNGLSYSAAYYQQGQMQPFDRGPGDLQKMHRRTDVRVSKAFKDVWGLNGDVSGVVQNLFKDNYTEYTASNVFDRRVYVTLGLNW